MIVKVAEENHERIARTSICTASGARLKFQTLAAAPLSTWRSGTTKWFADGKNVPPWSGCLTAHWR